MKLYSIGDMGNLVQELLHTTNFSTVRIKSGVVLAMQMDASGKVSQRFQIKIENTPADPV